MAVVGGRREYYPGVAGSTTDATARTFYGHVGRPWMSVLPPPPAGGGGRGGVNRGMGAAGGAGDLFGARQGGPAGAPPPPRTRPSPRPTPRRALPYPALPYPGAPAGARPAVDSAPRLLRHGRTAEDPAGPADAAWTDPNRPGAVRNDRSARRRVFIRARFGFDLAKCGGGGGRRRRRAGRWRASSRP